MGVGSCTLDLGSGIGGGGGGIKSSAAQTVELGDTSNGAMIAPIPYSDRAHRVVKLFYYSCSPPLARPSEPKYPGFFLAASKVATVMNTPAIRIA